MDTALGGHRSLRKQRFRPVSGRAHTSWHVRGAAASPDSCPHWWPACGRRPDVRPVGNPRRGYQHGHRHQPGHLCRIPAVRTAAVPEAADGQSADGSGSLQLPLLFFKAGPAGGRLRRPPSRRQRQHDCRGTRPHPPAEPGDAAATCKPWLMLAAVTAGTSGSPGRPRAGAAWTQACHDRRDLRQRGPPRLARTLMVSRLARDQSTRPWAPSRSSSWSYS
jgi:hypothetical protein